MVRKRDAELFNQLTAGEFGEPGEFRGDVARPVLRADVHPQGRYGWYVETDECEGEHTIYVGEYTSVTSEGDLLIWSRDHQPLYQFPTGSWRFALPQFEIAQWREKGERIELAARPLPAVVTETSVKPEFLHQFKFARPGGADPSSVM